MQEESRRYWHIPRVPGLEMLRADYTSQVFSKHIHDGYALGVIEKGALRFTYRGQKVLAPAGHVNMVIPGEAHDGSAADSRGWSYRMLYIDSYRLEKASQEITRNASLPFFPAGAVRDPALASAILSLHQETENPAADPLKIESMLCCLLVDLILRHAQRFQKRQQRSPDPSTVEKVREYIEANYSQNILLEDLCKQFHLSPFHLLRSFSSKIGLPPHHYLKQVRVRQAKALLRNPTPLIQIAEACGFSDQSHFNKNFKQITGISPGQYRNFVQENNAACR